MSVARGRVALVGMARHAPVEESWRVVRYCASSIYRESLANFRAIVLGAEALRELDAAVASVALAPVRARVVLCADATTPHIVVAPWIRCGFGEPVSDEDLSERIIALDRPHIRPWLEMEEWLPVRPQPESRAAAAAAMVHRLADLRVGTLARQLGWSRQTLRRVCCETFGQGPKDLLLSFVAASYTALRAAGATNAECAETLGYHDESALRRALDSAARGKRRCARGAISP